MTFGVKSLTSNGMKCFKPAIHYSQIWRIEDETIFSLNKILFAKTGRTCYYTPFVVHHQFSCEHIRSWNFFWRKTLRVCWRDPHLNVNPANSIRWKSCLRNMAYTYYKLFAVRHFFIISPLFRHCSWIVYATFLLNANALHSLVKDCWTIS